MIADKSKKIQNPSTRLEFLMANGKKIAENIEYYRNFREKAVGVKEFIESPHYLGMDEEVYPKVMDELVEMNTPGKYVEAVLTGAIGSGKTTVALLTTAYQLYLLSLYREPQKAFGLAHGDEIIFIFQSLNKKLAQDLDYGRFREMILKSPYFQTKFPFDKSVSSELRFPNRIIVKAVSGASTGAIGQNVFGGILDELNFMSVIENSKQSKDGGVRDQAWENYRAIVRRRESRFSFKGNLPGIFCLVSSKQYPGEFTEIKQQEARNQIAKYGKTKIFCYDKRVWDVKPLDRFSGEWFRLFIGDMTRKPRILDDDEVIPEHDKHLVDLVPKEFKHSFESDILSALRDIAGHATLALHPFIINTEAVPEAFGNVDNILSRELTDFTTTELAIYPKRFKNLQRKRFVHLDLSITGDSTGVACGYVSHFVKIERSPGEFEVMPNIVFDFVLEVKAPKNGEIQFEKVRNLLYLLHSNGLPITWVTLDTYQSTDTMQILRQKGFITGTQSLDVSPDAYDVFKSALVDRRIDAPEHKTSMKEIVQLERDPKTKKVDHPPQGSKDCADAMAGVVFGLTMRREIWLEHDIDLSDIPATVKKLANTGSKSVDGREKTKRVDQ